MEPGLKSQFATILAMMDRLEAAVVQDPIDLGTLAAMRVRFRSELAVHFAFKETLYDWMGRVGGYCVEPAVRGSRVGMLTLIDGYHGHIAAWGNDAIEADPIGYRAAALTIIGRVRTLIGGAHAELVPVLDTLIATGASPAAEGIVPPDAAI